MTGTTGRPQVGVLIAVKRLTAAKTRLAPVLSAAAREQLVLSCSASRTPGGRANRRPSRFLKDLLLTR